MAKLEKIIANKVSTRDMSGKEHIIGYYRNAANAQNEWGHKLDTKIESVEIYLDKDTDKIYVLNVAAPNGKFQD